MSNHVVISFATGQMLCQHCGEAAALRLPAPVGSVQKRTGAFVQLHEDCPAPNPDTFGPEGAAQQEQEQLGVSSLVKLVRVDPKYSNYVPALDQMVGKYFQVEGVNPFHADEVLLGCWYVDRDWLEPVSVAQLIEAHTATRAELEQMRERVARAEARWIPTAERLPEITDYCVRCIVLTADGEVMEAKYTVNKHASAARWRRPRWERAGRILSREITHWQPLPLPLATAHAQGKGGA